MSRLSKLVVGALALVVCPVAGVRLQAAQDTLAFLTKVPSHLPLCDEAVVQETCSLLNGQLNGTVTWEQVMEMLSARASAMADFWGALGLTGPVSCADLCEKVVDVLRNATTLPPKSDIGCYSQGNQVLCNVDLDPLKVLQDARFDGDLPDFHDKKPAHLARGAPLAVDEEDLEEGVRYTPEALLLRTANLFRIYPDTGVAVTKIAAGAADGNASSLVEADEEHLRNQAALQSANLESRKYVDTAIRMLRARQGDGVMQMWFGAAAPSSASKRGEILRVLNSVQAMLGNVEFVYPGPECDDRTYAYVYPEAYTCYTTAELNRRACTKNGNGQLVFYMCPLTLRSPRSVQIETMTHEGSHHSTAFTDDVCVDNVPANRCRNVAYGRSTCRMLARNQPAKALMNADNFCYYIQDLTDG